METHTGNLEIPATKRITQKLEKYVGRAKGGGKNQLHPYSRTHGDQTDILKNRAQGSLGLSSRIRMWFSQVDPRP